MGSGLTVTVEPIEGLNALRLRWNRWVNEHDIRPAFRLITDALNRANRPMHVVVDLRSDPNLPLPTTISETLAGPFMHAMMGEWIVIGSNQRAEVVAHVITAVGMRANIHWVHSEADAMARLKTLEEEATRGLIPSFEGLSVSSQPPDVAA